MPVGQLNSLEAIDFLNRVDQKFLDFLDAFNPQHIVRIDGAVGQGFSHSNAIAFIDH